MKLSKAYVVVGCTGKHSDQVTWNAKVFLSQGSANDHCEALNKICNEENESISNEEDWNNQMKLAKKLEDRLQLLDKKARVDYNGTEYTVEEVDAED